MASPHHSIDSLGPLPSTITRAVTAPPPPLILPSFATARWRDTMDSAPRTQCDHMRGRPPVNFIPLSPHLLAHTHCAGHMGAAHAATLLAIGGGTSVEPDSRAVHFLNNLKRRNGVEGQLRTAAAFADEIDKRQWLQVALSARAGASEPRTRVSRTAHASALASQGGTRDKALQRSRSEEARAHVAVLEHEKQLASDSIVPHWRKVAPSSRPPVAAVPRCSGRLSTLRVLRRAPGASVASFVSGSTISSSSSLGSVVLPGVRSPAAGRGTIDVTNAELHARLFPRSGGDA